MGVKINMISDLKDKIKQLKENNESNKKIIENKEKELQELKNQNSQYMSQANQLQSNNNELAQVSQKYKQTLEELKNEQNKNSQIMQEYENYKKNISQENLIKISQKDNEIENYLKQIQQNEVDISKSKIKINELSNKLKQNEIVMKNEEKEISDLKQKNNQKEAELKLQIENLKEQYKKTYEEELKKIRKGLLKQIGDKLNTEKKKFTELYAQQESKYSSKFNELSKIKFESKAVENSINPNVNSENKNIVNIDNNIPKPDTKIQNMMTNDARLFNQINNDLNNENNINENVIQNEIKNSNNNKSFLNNDDKNYTNKGPEENTGEIIKNHFGSINNNLDKSNGSININNRSNNNEIIEEEPGKEDEDYSYDCTNAMYLTVYIYEGTEEAEFEIFLKNNGKKTWASDSKIINDPSSSLKTNDIDLAQQKPNEERGYKVVIKNLGRKPNGEYKIIFLFYTNKNIIGDKITAMVKIKEKDNEKSEMEENMDKIIEFRDTFNLSEDEYSNEKIFEILKDNDFNFENAFSSLFN
jgi:hypothetical protein